MPRYEPLSADALATIHAGWKRLGKEVGVQFDNEQALQLFRDAGQTVDDDGTVHFDPEFLLAQAAKAPSEFSMRARNRARDLVIGGDHMIFCAVQGPRSCASVTSAARALTPTTRTSSALCKWIRTSIRRAATSLSPMIYRSTRATSCAPCRRFA